MRWLERLTGSRSRSIEPMDEAKAAADAGDYGAALAIWEPLARAGVARAQNNIGACFSEGLGVDRDPALAVKWLSLAAAAGDPIGQRNLATAYFNGLGVARDSVRAAELYRAAAEQGDGLAQDMLSWMLLEGDLIPADLAEARRWALAAAENGVAAAMTRLGKLYHDALGVERDPVRAADWWRRGAERGDADAQAMLGAAQYLGRGVPFDPVSALAWLLRARAAGGSALAAPFLGPARAALSPDEIAEAEQLARQALPGAAAMIIGTAGHIDHGKTALIKALTGVDGDRLKEEKARGITIDLGFAYLTVEPGRTLGFVDVPGHESFVHTMLAGASGIDFAMLAVAADDGVKPQTWEHLAILDLLGVPRGLVVLTKTDLVGPERLAAVADEIRAATVGTMLERAEILPVSVRAGQGVEELRARLVAHAADIADRNAEERFRLAIDRVFTLPGVGVVVTGPVLSGSVRAGDRVMISPSGRAARVRTLHAQNCPAQLGRAGERCALNLADHGVSKEAIRRGHVVLDPELHAPTDRIDARLRLLSSEAKPIGQWFPVRLHHAAAEVGAHVVLLGDDAIRAGETADVQLALDRPIAAAALDRFVIRDASAQRTIGGGQFLDLRPPTRRRRAPERRAQREAMAIADPSDAFAALLSAPPFAWDLAAFAQDRALSAADTDRLAETLGLVLLESGASRIAVSPDRWKIFSSSLLEQLAAYHGENPDQQGIGREKLRLLLQPRLPAPVFIVALRRAAHSGELVLDGAFVRLAAHSARLAPEDEAAWRIVAPLLGGAERFRPPRVRDIAEVTARPERDVRRLLKLAGRMGWADEIAHDHFFLRSSVCEMVTIVAEVAAQGQGGGFVAARFRDRVANGRKVAIQILDFFDRHGVTLRMGDLRKVNKHRLDLFGPLLSSVDVDGGESSLVGRSDFKSEWGSEPASGGFDSRSLPPATSGVGP